MSDDNKQTPVKLDEVVAATLAKLPVRLQAEYLASVEHALKREANVYLARAGKSRRAYVRADVETVLPELKKGVIYYPGDVQKLLEARWARGSIANTLNYFASSQDYDLIILDRNVFMRLEDGSPTTKSELVKGVKKRISEFQAKNVEGTYGIERYKITVHEHDPTAIEKLRDEHRRKALYAMFESYIHSNPEWFTRIKNEGFAAIGEIKMDVRDNIIRHMGEQKMKQLAIEDWCGGKVIYSREEFYWEKLDQVRANSWSTETHKKIVTKEEISEGIRGLTGLLSEFVVQELKPLATRNDEPVYWYNPQVLLQKRQARLSKQ